METEHPTTQMYNKNWSKSSDRHYRNGTLELQTKLITKITKGIMSSTTNIVINDELSAIENFLAIVPMTGYAVPMTGYAVPFFSFSETDLVGIFMINDIIS
ncbi:hypothetical protein BGZ65_012866 [Modicella reniformis]|uniref:Uncharacterized protein n=1 Tax=Modicella reniformis TaxID=1440133 RepID=A0A9P6SR28_9FUNG|nr:hypothetical protein BGZ65_012866 [Modicella reniformis]